MIARLRSVKVFFVFLLCFSIGRVAAQEGTKRTLGVSAAISFNENWSFDPIYNYSLTASSGQHLVFAGVLLTKLDAYPTVNNQLPGFQAGYQFYPFKKDKIFIPFLEYDLNLISYKRQSEGEIICSYKYTYEYTSASRLQFDDLLSIGCKVQLPWHFYLNASVGGGFEWDQYKDTHRYNNGDVLSYNSGLYRYQDVSLLYKAGLGFDMLHCTHTPKSLSK